MFHEDRFDLENDIPKCVIPKGVAFNPLEYNICELRLLVWNTIFSTKSDTPFLALYFVGNQQVVVNGQRHLPYPA
jgi:hypothetical protein